MQLRFEYDSERSVTGTWWCHSSVFVLYELIKSVKKAMTLCRIVYVLNGFMVSYSMASYIHFFSKSVYEWHSCVKYH